MLPQSKIKKSKSVNKLKSPRSRGQQVELKLSNSFVPSAGQKLKIKINNASKNLTVILKTKDRVSAREKKNSDLKELWDPPLLPKVKSTIYSHPKFVGKSYLLTGVNKYIGGTFRNTGLQEQS